MTYPFPARDAAARVSRLGRALRRPSGEAGIAPETHRPNYAVIPIG